MSESSISAATAPAQRSRLWIVSITGILILLGLGYLGGYLILPNTIRSAFQENHCENVLSRSDLYQRLYPSMQQDIAALVGECAVFTLALTRGQENAWSDAYNAFTVYSESYPEGRFADEAHVHLSTVLIGLARAELEQENHPRALALIDRVLREYDDPSILREAESLKLELYMDWSANLRDAGEFAEAERILTEVRNSAMPQFQESSQLALAQTYLAWGHELQSQQEFEQAKLKIDTAVSIDPSVNSQPAEFYKQWGDYLLEQGDYANATGHYATAAGFSTDTAAGQEIIAEGYVRWAQVLSSKDDFIGALALLDFTQSTIGTDATKTLVEKARSDTYLAFSQSDGEQSRQAMLDAAKVVCLHQATPRLPIFGLDAENAGLLVEGADGELPNELAAATPGSMRYVACVRESTTVVGAATHAIGSWFFDPNAAYSTVPVLFQAIQYNWAVSLRQADNAQEIDTTTINGGDPPSLPTSTREIYEGARNPQYFGKEPEFADLVEWLQTVLK